MQEGAVDPLTAPPDPAPLARQTLAYGLSGLIAPLVGLITLPIFARVFSQGEYGVIELGTTVMSVAVAITDIGLASAALRSYYDYTAEHESERRSVMLTGFATTTVIAVTVTIVLIALRTDVSRWVFGSSDQATLVILIALSMPGLNTWRYVSEVMRVRLQAFHYLATSLIAASVTTILGVTGVLAFSWRVDGVFFAALVGNLIAAVYALVVVRDGLSGRFSWPKLKPMLTYGLPLVPATLASLALALVDRIILSRLGSLDQVGQYAIANRLSSLILIGVTAFLFALTPFLFAIYSENPGQEKAARARATTYLTVILGFCGLALTLFARELIDLVAPAFDQSYKAVGPLMLGAIGYGLVSVLTTGFSLARKTGRLALLAVGAAAVNIGLNFALIPPWGIVGAGVATAIGYGALAVAYYIVAQRVYQTPYELRKLLVTLGLASVLGALGVAPLGPEPLPVLIKLLALAAFGAGLWVTGTVRGAELIELRKFARGMLPLPLDPSRA